MPESRRPMPPLRSRFVRYAVAVSATAIAVALRAAVLAPLWGAQGGLGIGLTLVKQLAERHGGSGEAQSPGPGRGTTVTVRFPAIATPPMEVERRASVAEGSRRILIVEDNRDAREMLRFMLELWHHTVREAADGPSGIDAALQFKPDIAIVDVGLPGLDGYEVAGYLRVSGRAPGLRLIALTAYGLPKDAERAREAGFDAHLVKLVRPERLMEVLTLTHRGADT